MRKFNMLFKWSWTFLVAITLAFGLAGCEGDDGSAGAAGAAGAAGTDGADGQACWDLNNNGVGDEEEDLNDDGIVDGFDCNPNADFVAAAIDAAKPESCATCHGDVGEEEHQSVYDKYTDASTFDMTFTNFTSVPGAVAGTFDLTLELTILKNGVPFTDAETVGPVEDVGENSLQERRFYAAQYDSATRQYEGNLFIQLNDTFTQVADGDYVLTEAGYPFDPTVNGQIYGYIAQTPLFGHDASPGSELPEGTHVHIYDDVANTALAFGDAAVTSPNAYQSYANVSGCATCHGTPYLKHGFRDPIVAGTPDFASCKSCHYASRDGFTEDFQWMVDEPLNWATGAATTSDYTYESTIMNNTHMAHAMEFPYPQSASNCNTCHEGWLTQVLDNSNFTAETCQSCHAIQGIDAWPQTFSSPGNEVLDENGRSIVQPYFQPHRAPALEYLWTRGSDLTFHDVEAFPGCTGCHGAGIAPAFNEYHTGYDVNIYDATGQKYAELYTVSIDQVTRSGDLLTVNFSSNNPDIVPELLVSFYGWDSKHFLVGSHERDANVTECAGRRPGCLMEYVPESSGGDPSPLFTEDPASVPGNWMVTLDYSLLQLFKTDDLPTLIANGDITKAEISVAPELTIDGTDVVLAAVAETFDLDAGIFVPDYFQGANAIVEIDKCNACHDALASTFHSESGRGGDGVQVCKNCHTTTFPGSHLEMASRSIESYVHAIHSFQDFDVGDTFETFDPVDAKRYDQHIKHVFPNFTIRNCEACHRKGTYNVPDQSQSMPGVLATSDDVATWYDIDEATELAVENTAGRNIGFVPELVTGPASRACGACHRSRLINQDEAGALASFNAHTEAGGTLVENDTEDDEGTSVDDEVVFGVIDKIMSMFE
ncbi:MAG: hypothetical protein OER91_05255 [Gammaproteobacteria bacterium]|nr:hypothetical protein [Gammaproteobacteria bacterium]